MPLAGNAFQATSDLDIVIFASTILIMQESAPTPSSLPSKNHTSTVRTWINESQQFLELTRSIRDQLAVAQVSQSRINLFDEVNRLQFSLEQGYKAMEMSLQQLSTLGVICIELPVILERYIERVIEIPVEMNIEMNKINPYGILNHDSVSEHESLQESMRRPRVNLIYKQLSNYQASNEVDLMVSTNSLTDIKVALDSHQQAGRGKSISVQELDHPFQKQSTANFTQQVGQSMEEYSIMLETQMAQGHNKDVPAKANKNQQPQQSSSENLNQDTNTYQIMLIDPNKKHFQTQQQNLEQSKLGLILDEEGSNQSKEEKERKIPTSNFFESCNFGENKQNTIANQLGGEKYNNDLYEMSASNFPKSNTELQYASICVVPTYKVDLMASINQHMVSKTEGLQHLACLTSSPQVSDYFVRMLEEKENLYWQLQSVKKRMQQAQKYILSKQRVSFEPEDQVPEGQLIVTRRENQIQQVIEKLSETEQRYRQVVRRYQELSEMYQELENQRARLEERCSLLAQRSIELGSLNEEGDTQRDYYLYKYNEVNQKYTESQVNCRDLVGQRDLLDEKLEKYQERIEELTQKLEQYSLKMEEMKMVTGENQQTIVQLQERNESLEGKIYHSQEMAQKYQEKIILLQSSIQTAKEEEVIESRMSATKRSVTLEELEVEKHSLVVVIDQLNQDIIHLNRIISARQEEVKLLSGEVEKLKAKSREAEQKIQKKQDEIKLYKEDKLVLIQKAARVESLLKEERSRWEGLQVIKNKTIGELEADVEELKEQVKNLERNIRQVEGEWENHDNYERLTHLEEENALDLSERGISQIKTNGQKRVYADSIRDIDLKGSEILEMHALGTPVKKRQARHSVRNPDNPSNTPKRDNSDHKKARPRASMANLQYSPSDKSLKLGEVIPEEELSDPVIDMSKFAKLSSRYTVENVKVEDKEKTDKCLEPDSPIHESKTERIIVPVNRRSNFEEQYLISIRNKFIADQGSKVSIDPIEDSYEAIETARPPEKNQFKKQTPQTILINECNQPTNRARGLGSKGTSQVHPESNDVTDLNFNEADYLNDQPARRRLLHELHNLLSKMSYTEDLTRIKNIGKQLYLDAELRERINSILQRRVLQLQDELENRCQLNTQYTVRLEQSLMKSERLLNRYKMQQKESQLMMRQFQEQNYVLRNELSKINIQQMDQFQKETDELIQDLTSELQMEKYGTALLAQQNSRLKDSLRELEREILIRNRNIQQLSLRGYKCDSNFMYGYREIY